MGRFDSSEMKRLQRELEKLQKNTNIFVEECAKELAARFLTKVIKRTPVGDYPKGTGKKGGTLRRGWTAQNGRGTEGASTRDAAQFVDTLNVHHYGGTYIIEITNPIEYASYVEYGHRTANHKGWVPGRFMMTISEQELQQIAPGVLEKKLAKFFEGVMK